MTPNQVEFPNDRNRPEAFVTSDLGTRVREYFTTILQLHTVIYLEDNMTIHPNTVARIPEDNAVRAEQEWK